MLSHNSRPSSYDLLRLQYRRHVFAAGLGQSWLSSVIQPIVHVQLIGRKLYHISVDFWIFIIYGYATLRLPTKLLRSIFDDNWNISVYVCLRISRNRLMFVLWCALGLPVTIYSNSYVIMSQYATVAIQVPVNYDETRKVREFLKNILHSIESPPHLRCVLFVLFFRRRRSEGWPEKGHNLVGLLC